MTMYAKVGNGGNIHENVVLGLQYTEKCAAVEIGDGATIRWGSVIYADVAIGHGFQTGHSVLIREMTVIGDHVVVGTNTVIDGQTEIGSHIKLESNVYIPTQTRIADRVFIGPGAVLTNDKYPQRLRDAYEPIGPILEESVTIGANATLLPGVRIGEGTMVAAGAVVTQDIPPWSLAVGAPAQIKPLPERLKERNRAKSE